MSKMNRHIRDNVHGIGTSYTQYRNFAVQYNILEYPKALVYQVYLQNTGKCLYHELIGDGLISRTWIGDTFYYE